MARKIRCTTSKPPTQRCDGIKSEEKAKKEEGLSGDENAKSAFQKVDKPLKGDKKLPSGLFIKSVETKARGAPVTKGLAYIHYSPSGGLVERAVVQISNGKEIIWSLVFQSLDRTCRSDRQSGGAERYGRRMSASLHRHQRAFTLLEVLLAMVLLSAALMLLANSWSAAFNRVKKTQISFELASLLERKMNDFERKYKGKPLSEIQDSEEDDFGDEYPQYSWNMKSKKFEFPDIASTLTAKDGGVDAMTQMVIKQMTEQISKNPSKK